MSGAEEKILEAGRLLGGVLLDERLSKDDPIYRAVHDCMNLLTVAVLRMNAVSADAEAGEVFEAGGGLRPAPLDRPFS